MTKRKFQPLRGFPYYSEKECKIYNFIRKEYLNLLNLYNIKFMMPPLLWPQSLFLPLGESTDVVKKELYSFLQKDGEEVCLLPEHTRVMVEQFAYEGKNFGKYGSFAPCFRYERPQKGRYRSFNQASVEYIGYSHYMSDVELIVFTENLLKNIGIEDGVLHINTIGGLEDRKIYMSKLKDYFEPLLEKMSNFTREKFERGAYLRILDTKEEIDFPYLENGPKMETFLSEGSRENYEKIKTMLNSLNIKYVENPFLVRGLDYYNDLVFEYTHSFLGAQSSMAGGGRYDGLCLQSIGSNVPAVGFGLGIDRLIIILDKKMEANLELKNKILEINIRVNLIPVEDTEFSYTFQVIEELKKSEKKISFEVLCDKSLSKRLEKSEKVDYALIFGETEKEKEVVLVKNMKERSSKEVPLKELKLYFNENL